MNILLERIELFGDPRAKNLSNGTTDQQIGPGSVRDLDHLVVLIHGINTRALWMDDVKPALEDAGFTVASTSFGQFKVVRFLWPEPLWPEPFWLRPKAINRVATEIRTARRSFIIN